jgi:hypothetical protein
MCSTALAGDDWSIDKPYDEIPDTPVTGKIFGRDLGPGEVTISGHALTFESKAKLEGWAESEVLIFVGTNDEESEWTVTPKDDRNAPHVHMKFAKAGDRFPSTLMYTEEYSMRLVLTEITDEYVKGKVHLSLPDYKKSYLIGSFTAKVR